MTEPLCNDVIANRTGFKLINNECLTSLVPTYDGDTRYPERAEEDLLTIITLRRQTAREYKHYQAKLPDAKNVKSTVA